MSPLNFLCLRHTMDINISFPTFYNIFLFLLSPKLSYHYSTAISKHDNRGQIMKEWCDFLEGWCNQEIITFLLLCSQSSVSSFKKILNKYRGFHWIYWQSEFFILLYWQKEKMDGRLSAITRQIRGWMKWVMQVKSETRNLHTRDPRWTLSGPTANKWATYF